MIGKLPIICLTALLCYTSTVHSWAESSSSSSQRHRRSFRLFHSSPNTASSSSSFPRYHILAAQAAEPLALQIQQFDSERFVFHKTHWNKFPDGTDNIEMTGFYPHNELSGQHVLFLASFHNNDVTLSQFQVLICLLQSFVASLTVVLPYSPVGTMERVTREGQVATAATYAHMFSSLPSCGRPTRLMVYDLHTLQNRFYLHGNAVASLHSAIPLLKRQLKSTNIDGIAFPDDGAAKRFGAFFQDEFELIVCGKTRGPNDQRTVVIQDGNVAGKHICIVDDLVQTGGTLYESALVLKQAGAASVSAFVTHAVFPNQSFQRFNVGGDRHCFDKFWVTNSIPTVTSTLPVEDGVFEVLDLTELILHDLDYYTTNSDDW
ncbi:hypothetical protein FisN_31Lh022 [Fistulifera solaris]|uniref:Phosphoribosyltransferase domain-containing protein n=1 Tax=Fistulifera solaris TaxID=1519565 RepID=A0A1Z5K672_FISSO|nr:hypothetical protein FisN_31Lh022 [Fistulifera solaris]|eukprot:GAX21737.1 hypothetical protein FisN_31Lh022 [Fistulifera solaris]